MVFMASFIASPASAPPLPVASPIIRYAVKHAVE
jgi:hypothetical protein